MTHPLLAGCPHATLPAGLGPESGIDGIDVWLRLVEHTLCQPPMRIGVRAAPTETFSFLTMWARAVRIAGTHHVRALPGAEPCRLLFVPVSARFPFGHRARPRDGAPRRGTGTVITSLGASGPVTTPVACDVVVTIVTPDDLTPYDECPDVRLVSLAAPRLAIEPLEVVLHHSNGHWYDDLLPTRGPRGVVM